MNKMWAGRTDGITDHAADDFNSSLRFDCRMYKQDIQGSIAHAKMLGRQQILTEDETKKIVAGLTSILEDMESGQLQPNNDCEDIHMFVEQILTQRIGDTGKKLHTARSRNDQVATDLRLYLREASEDIVSALCKLLATLLDLSEKFKTYILPGYTHLQRAQPILFSQHLLAYAQMFKRDIGRLEDASERMNVSPLGSCALAGTTFPTDRAYAAELLGFDGITENSIDGVSDRDFCVEMLSDLSLIMMHLSRFSEEIILWSSWEFKFVELSDAYTTGSSIMPQKKNADMAELVRGKTGRVYGHLMGMLTMLKGLPLAYNKDMQEDKEAVFDALDTVSACLSIFTAMLATMQPLPENMYKAAQTGFINATDLADYLAVRGVPFRSAYALTGQIVNYCIHADKTLEAMTLAEYKTFSPVFENDLYEAIDLKNCVERRTSAGGTGTASIEVQIVSLKNFLENKNI